MTEELDVIIVGAGLSGVSAAYHLQTRCPGKTFAILEARGASGGTWDLFRYPGIRSDSDMHTLGYSWRPWPGAKAIADGPSILEYVRSAAQEHGIDRTIRYHHAVEHAAWSSEDASWTLDVKREHESTRLRCKFLYVCAGYYNYAAGYKPTFAGESEYQGQVVHPQHWPSDLDWTGKRVIVIGSGATAVTLVPALAEKAAQVTMLQRSPSYVVTVPARDGIADKLREHLPQQVAYDLTRWKNVLLGMMFFQLSRRAPDAVKRGLLTRVQTALGADFDVAKHFTPRYRPWDQRMCLVPDGDLFESLRKGHVSIVTDAIDRFTAHGIRLASGDELAADIIVTATGLELQSFGGMSLHVDGKRIEPHDTMAYRGSMFSDVPNLAVAFGYTNASWTLKADLTAEFVCRVLQRMDAKGFDRCVPRRNDPRVEERPWLDFTSGYVQRGIARFPKQGSIAPFRLYQNYLLDLMAMRYGRLDDGVLEFSATPASSGRRDAA
jgi:monooxygenase